MDGPKYGFEKQKHNPVYTDPESMGDPTAKARINASNAAERIGSTPEQRAGLVKGYVPGYGKPAANNNMGGLLNQHDWNSQFQTRSTNNIQDAKTGINAGLSVIGGLTGIPMPSPYSDATRSPVARNATTPGAAAAIADPNDWRGKTGIANPPPATPRAPLYNPTQQVYMKPIPAPLTGPNGNAVTDRANFDANRAMYAPGGLTESPAEHFDRIANGGQATPEMRAAAGTGQNIADSRYGTASSTFVHPSPVASALASAPYTPAPLPSLPSGGLSDPHGIMYADVGNTPKWNPIAGGAQSNPTTQPAPQQPPNSTPNYDAQGKLTGYIPRPTPAAGTGAISSLISSVAKATNPTSAK